MVTVIWLFYQMSMMRSSSIIKIRVNLHLSICCWLNFLHVYWQLLRFPLFFFWKESSSYGWSNGGNLRSGNCILMSHRDELPRRHRWWLADLRRLSRGRPSGNLCRGDRRRENTVNFYFNKLGYSKFLSLKKQWCYFSIGELDSGCHGIKSCKKLWIKKKEAVMPQGSWLLPFITPFLMILNHNAPLPFFHFENVQKLNSRNYTCVRLSISKKIEIFYLIQKDKMK